MDDPTKLVPRGKVVKRIHASAVIEWTDPEIDVDTREVIVDALLKTRVLQHFCPDRPEIVRHADAVAKFSKMYLGEFRKSTEIENLVLDHKLRDGTTLSQRVGASRDANAFDVFTSAVRAFYAGKQTCDARLQRITRASGRVYIAMSDIRLRLSDAIDSCQQRIDTLTEKERKSPADKVVTDFVELRNRLNDISNTISLALHDDIQLRNAAQSPIETVDKVRRELDRWKVAFGQVSKTAPVPEADTVSRVESVTVSTLYKSAEALRVLADVAHILAQEKPNFTPTEDSTNVARSVRALAVAVLQFTGRGLKAKSTPIKRLVEFATAVLNIQYVAIWEYVHSTRFANVEDIYAEKDTRFLQRGWLEGSTWSMDNREAVSKAYD